MAQEAFFIPKKEYLLAPIRLFVLIMKFTVAFITK